MPEYEINISRHGHHWAKYIVGTASHLDADAVEHFYDLRKRFPVSEGFRVSLTKWVRSGVQLVYTNRDGEAVIDG